MVEEIWAMLYELVRSDRTEKQWSEFCAIVEQGDSSAYGHDCEHFSGLYRLLCCLGFRFREAIAALALVMSLVQGFDGLIGVLAHDLVKTYGPFVFALGNVAALVWLLRSDERGPG
jgi:hypothetical protein